MRVLLHDLFGALPYALAMWLVLVGAVIVGCAFAAAPALRRRHRAARAHASAARLRQVHLGAQAADLNRHAEEVAVAAANATVTAKRREDEWEAVCRARDAAWRAYTAADEAASRAIRAAAFPVSATPPGPAELRSRERHLHRVATEAYRRGELSIADLTDALAHRNGWDLHRHLADHEVTLRRIARERRLAGYQAVAALEANARRAAEIAASAATSLGHEATAATARAERAAEILAVQGRRVGRHVAIGSLASAS